MRLWGSLSRAEKEASESCQRAREESSRGPPFGRLSPRHNHLHSQAPFVDLRPCLVPWDPSNPPSQQAPSVARPGSASTSLAPFRPPLAPIPFFPLLFHLHEPLSLPPHPSRLLPSPSSHPPPSRDPTLSPIGGRRHLHLPGSHLSPLDPTSCYLFFPLTLCLSHRPVSGLSE